MSSSQFESVATLRYRPEIDGLRAIAVIAVVLYHAEFTLLGINLFKGGFIGVDVFFVISGYLITGIILKGIVANSFTYANFYERRARRILPALFTVMAASIPFAMALMQLNPLKEFSGSALSSLFYSSNVWFWLEDSYTAEPSALKPFLHTWSLSVEEQFYFVFPITLLLIWRFARSHMLAIFVLLFLLSLQWAQLGSRLFVDATFFLLPARGWELLAGAILAKIQLDKGRGDNPILNTTMPALGLFLITYAFVFFDDQMRHPAYITLLPVVGTMLLIWFCKPGELVSKVLSSKPMVGVGLVSYSLYLWHFPIFVFSRIADFTSASDRLLQIALAILLAAATYFLIEKPTRDSSRTSSQFIVTLLIVVFCLLVSAFGYQYYHSNKALEEFVVADRVFDVEKEKSRRFEYSKRVCPSIGWAQCSKPQAGKTNVLVVGDSMAPDAVNLLEPSFPSFHYMLDAHGACPPHPNIRTLVPASHPELIECERRNSERFSPASLEGVDSVVIMAFYDWFRPADLEPYLSFLRGAGMVNVIIFGNYFELNDDFPEAIAVYGKSSLTDSSSSAFHSLVKIWPQGEEELKAVSESYGFTYISLMDAACLEGTCRLFERDVPFTWDRAHLSLEFAQSLSPQLQRQVSGKLGNQSD